MKEEFFDLPSEVTTALGTLAGFALLGRLNTNQQNSLGNLLELTGQVLLASAAQRQLLEQSRPDPDLVRLEDRIRALEERLRQMEGSNG